MSQQIIWDDQNDFSKIVISVMAKSLQTTRAIFLLCQNGLGQDALSSARVMFENLIDFRYMHADKKRVRDFIDFDLNYKLKLGRIIESRSDLQGVDKEKMKKRQQELEAEWNKVKHRFTRKNAQGKEMICSRWSCKDLRAMAEELELVDAYDFFYVYASSFVHSTAAVANEYVLGREGDSVVVEVGASEIMVERVLSTARAIFMSILDIVNDEYKLGFDEKIKQLSPKPKKKMKTLKFKSYLVNKILSGTKTITWRLFDDKNLIVGDELTFINSDTGEEFAKAKITEVKEKKLGEIQESDFDSHEKYESKESMLEHYRGYYGDKVTTDSVVKMIRFQLIKE